MGRDEDEDQADAGDRGRQAPTRSDDDERYGGDQETEQERHARRRRQAADHGSDASVDSKKQDLVYRIEARVTDAGNREIAGHGFALATYGSFFLTAEPNSYVYSKGSTATITVTAQDYDKKPVQTSFRVEMNRWNWRKGAGPVVITTRKARPTPAARRRSS